MRKEETTQLSNVGRKPIPETLLKERKDYTVSLKIAGMSTATILKMVNSKAVVKGWGEVTRLTVERDIADYYRKNRVLTAEDFDHLDNMRQSIIDNMEVNIEKMILHIKGNKNWKPFEYITALVELNKMYMNYAELQNWNLGRKNMFLAAQQNNLNVIFDDANREMKSADNQTLKQFKDIVGELLNNTPQDTEIKVIDNVNDI